MAQLQDHILIEKVMQGLDDLGAIEVQYISKCLVYFYRNVSQVQKPAAELGPEVSHSQATAESVAFANVVSNMCEYSFCYIKS